MFLRFVARSVATGLVVLALGCAPREPRVLLIGFDGLDPETVDLLIAEGGLPNFARMRREGAYGRMKSFEPMLSPILWTTIATGRTPDAHGIGHFVALDPATGESLPVTSDLRKVRALWEILSERERSTAVVGWWATWPPERIRGWMVSDHLAYHFLFGDGLAGGDRSVKTSPPELEAEIAPLVVRPQAIGRTELAPFAAVGPADLERPLDLQDDLSHLRWLVATAETHRRIGLELWREERPDTALVYFEGTDSVAHLFGHLFRARGLAGELATQQARFGGAVEAMYRRADEILGDFLAAAGEETTVIVLSDHGFELGVLPDDPSRLRDMRRVSERFHRPEGVLYAWGRGVKAGARFDGATLLDVAPTVLALHGLPASAEMPGRVLAEGFVRLAVPERVATFESTPRGVATASRDAEADRALLEHLESLGYLGGPRRDAAGAGSLPAGVSSPQAERNLAAIAFQEKRYDEAERRYRALIAADAGDAGLRSSLAGVLGALGRYDEAMRELDAALAADPINPEGYHNKGVLLERTNRTAEAIEQYRTAVRYRPDFEPSRQALARLTGSAEVRAPRDEAEARATALCEAAADAARRGDYPAAFARLEEAKRAAPGSVLPHQYESNVAYLAGDVPRAIAALERALELEPGNALFRHNLEQLRRQ
jgi:predicted AlkP superfamily phosphohydrolase/phosphomutase/Tfp pilus assembly protein PilF